MGEEFGKVKVSRRARQCVTFTGAVDQVLKSGIVNLSSDGLNDTANILKACEFQNNLIALSTAQYEF